MPGMHYASAIAILAAGVQGGLETTQLRRMLSFDVHTGDVEIASMVGANGLAAEQFLLGKRVAIVARVDAVKREARGIVVSLSPRHAATFVPLSCWPTSSALPRIAQLRSGQLAVFTGKMKGSSRRFALEHCGVAYAFEKPATFVARSSEACLLRLGAPFSEAYRARIRGDTAGKPLPCANPIVGIVALCEHYMASEEKKTADFGVSESCSRKEILAILNELLIDGDEPKTRAENGSTLQREEKPRSALFDAFVKSGAIPDDDP